MRLNGLNRLNFMLQVTTYYKYLLSETATAIGNRKNMIQYKGEINKFFGSRLTFLTPLLLSYRHLIYSTTQ